jgi:hypothetical protein
MKPFPYRRTWDINPKTQVVPKKNEPESECEKCQAYKVNPKACETCDNGD